MGRNTQTLGLSTHTLSICKNDIDVYLSHKNTNRELTHDTHYLYTTSNKGYENQYSSTIRKNGGTSCHNSLVS